MFVFNDKVSEFFQGFLNLEYYFFKNIWTGWNCKYQSVNYKLCNFVWLSYDRV